MAGHDGECRPLDGVAVWGDPRAHEHDHEKDGTQVHYKDWGSGPVSQGLPDSDQRGSAHGLHGMSARLARRSFLIGSGILTLALVGGRLVGAASKPTITVHKSPT